MTMMVEIEYDEPPGQEFHDLSADQARGLNCIVCDEPPEVPEPIGYGRHNVPASPKYDRVGSPWAEYQLFACAPGTGCQVR